MSDNGRNYHNPPPPACDHIWVRHFHPWIETRPWTNPVYTNNIVHHEISLWVSSHARVVTKPHPLPIQSVEASAMFWGGKLQPATSGVALWWKRQVLNLRHQVNTTRYIPWKTSAKTKWFSTRKLWSLASKRRAEWHNIWSSLVRSLRQNICTHSEEWIQREIILWFVSHPRANTIVTICQGSSESLSNLEAVRLSDKIGHVHQYSRDTCQNSERSDKSGVFET